MANKEQLNILNQGVEVWNKWTAEHIDEEIDLREANLREANLQGAILQKANLIKANLIKANLQRANLQRANLQRANLIKTNLQGANLQRVNLIKANLIKANLTKANLQRANLQRANLGGANLQRANLQRAILLEAYLEGANLQRAILLEAYLEEADLEGADLEEAYLGEADLQGAILLEADLEGANLEGANLEGTNLRKADLQGADLQRANLQGADLVGASPTGVKLSYANITGASLYGTARDDWVMDGIQCDYVFWDIKGKERTPKDRDFRPGEFEELYKHLPIFKYYFEQGFTPIDAVVMDRVVQAINEKQPGIELRLDSFHSRGQPHAVFTVLHKESLEEAQKQVKENYESRLAALEGKQEQMMSIFAMLTSKPQLAIPDANVDFRQVPTIEKAQTLSTILSQRGSELRKAYALETDAATKFKLKHQIAQNNEDLKQVEQRLAELEEHE